jgi:hypothetical protein
MSTAATAKRNAKQQVNSQRRGRIAAFTLGAVASKDRPSKKTIDVEEKRNYDEELYSDDDMKNVDRNNDNDVDDDDDVQQVQSGLRGAGLGLGLGLLGGVALGSALAYRPPYYYGAYGYPYGYNYGYGNYPPPPQRGGGGDYDDYRHRERQQRQSRGHLGYYMERAPERRDGDIFAVSNDHRRVLIKDPFV